MIFRDVFQVIQCALLPRSHVLNKHLSPVPWPPPNALLLWASTCLRDQSSTPLQTPSGPSCTWVIYDLWWQGTGCSRSWCVLGSHGSRALLSYLLLGSQFALVPSPFLLWRCFPCLSLLSSPSSVSSFSFPPLHSFPFFLCCSLPLFSSSPVYSILSTLVLALLLSFLSSSLPRFSLSQTQRKGSLGELAHQEYTNTGFEYFLWRERRVREPLRSSTSGGPISNWYPLELHKSWRELRKFSMTALAAQTSDFPLHWFGPEPTTPRFGVSQLLSNLGRGQWREGALKRNNPGFLDSVAAALKPTTFPRMERGGRPSFIEEGSAFGTCSFARPAAQSRSGWAEFKGDSRVSQGLMGPDPREGSVPLSLHKFFLPSIICCRHTFCLQVWLKGSKRTPLKP